METFDKIRKYYAQFDEWSRLDSASGILERAEVIHMVSEYIPAGSHILDLGAGPGRYAIEFAKRGYTLSLIDLSDRLIEIAKVKFAEQQLTTTVKDFQVGNATNLAHIERNHFDAIFSCGPYYHLVEEKDRISFAQEAIRVCKPNGIIMIGMVPRFSGLAGLIYRAAQGKGQVDSAVFKKAAEEGVFHNSSASGFQEGYYPTVSEAKTFWSSMGLSQIEVLSTRTFMHQNEQHLMTIREADPTLFDTIIAANRKFAKTEAFVEAGGHAVLIGRKV